MPKMPGVLQLEVIAMSVFQQVTAIRKTGDNDTELCIELGSYVHVL